jgi:hypothetical protein
MSSLLLLNARDRRPLILTNARATVKTSQLVSEDLKYLREVVQRHMAQQPSEVKQN